MKQKVDFDVQDRIDVREELERKQKRLLAEAIFQRKAEAVARLEIVLETTVNRK